MDKRNFAFYKVNFILLAIGMIVVIIGFVLMSGGGSTEEAYDPSIFSPMRIKVAPVVCLLGFVSMIYAIIRKPKDE
jgi:membrane-bound ClpP family serine protease